MNVLLVYDDKDYGTVGDSIVGNCVCEYIVGDLGIECIIY